MYRACSEVFFDINYLFLAPLRASRNFLPPNCRLMYSSRDRSLKIVVNHRHIAAQCFPQSQLQRRLYLRFCISVFKHWEHSEKQCSVFGALVLSVYRTRLIFFGPVHRNFESTSIGSDGCPCSSFLPFSW